MAGTSITLKDANGVLWQLTVADSGVLSTTQGVGTGVAVAAIPRLIDNSAGTTAWQLAISTGGITNTVSIPVAGYPNFIPLISPAGVPWNIVVSSSGIIGTVPGTLPPVVSVYGYLSFSAAKQQLANRLYDSGMVFWSDAELGLYIAEALRTWNAMTSYWRGDFVFQSQQNVTWYDLTDGPPLGAMPNTLRALNLLDTDIYAIIQYHLLEPSVGVNPWTGVSAQFTSDDLVSAVQRRRDEMLSVCGHNITRRLVGAVGGRIVLPDTVLDIRRMAYLPASPLGSAYGAGDYSLGLYGVSTGGVPANSVVWSDDTWAEQSYDHNYTLRPAGTPLVYLLSTQPSISFDTDVPPGYGGQYELLTVEAGPALSTTSAKTLATPDDWTHVLKWGALADLLSRESNARDPLRAAYCETRYRMGLQLLSNASALLAMRANNVPLQVDSVHSADLYRTSWQGLAASMPDTALHAGLNLIALTPAPAMSVSLTATVIRNAPIPTKASDLVQVGRDDYDAIIDYAQHIAAFKQGGEEFLSTMPLLERFMKQAANYGLKLAELGEYTSMLYGLSQREEQMNPRLVPDTTEVASA